MTRALSVLITAAMLIGVSQGQKATSNGQEQTSFRTGGKPVVRHPVPISDAELAVIRKAVPVWPQEIYESKKARIPDFSRTTGEGLEAAAVHLGSPYERDLIVIGSGPRYISDTSPFRKLAPFWVIREGLNGPKVVLAIFTQTLEIAPQKHWLLSDLNAYRDTGMGGSTTTYQFDGHSYFEFIEVVN